MEILLILVVFVCGFAIGIRLGNYADFQAYREHVDTHTLRLDLPNCPYCREERGIATNQKWWSA